MANNRSNRVVDIVLAIYFIIHIPITMMFATQVIIGPSSSLIPEWMNNVLMMAIESSNDPLLQMAINPLARESWAISIFWQEVLIQLPLFIALAYWLITDSKSKYFEWASLFYSGQAIGCFIPVMTHLYVETGMHLVPSYIMFGIMPMILLSRTISLKSTKLKTK